MSAPTAIVAPLAAELAGVLAATSDQRVTRLGPLGHERGHRRPWREWGREQRWRRPALTLGSLAGEDVALMATGDGPAAAAAGLEARLAAVRPRRLLVVGVAGGLTPGLAEGALVAARQVVDAGGRAVPQAPDAAWLDEAIAGGALAGTVISADHIAAGPTARQAILRAALAPGALGATTVATVDLESAAYARVAAARSLPYLIVRAVLDPADEQLPLDFEACRDRSGRVSNARVVLRALVRPRSFGELWRLRARVRAAAARLGDFARRLVAATPATAATAASVAPAERSEVTEVTDMTEVVEQRRDNAAAVAGRRTA